MINNNAQTNSFPLWIIKRKINMVCIPSEEKSLSGILIYIDSKSITNYGVGYFTPILKNQIRLFHFLILQKITTNTYINTASFKDTPNIKTYINHVKNYIYIYMF